MRELHSSSDLRGHTELIKRLLDRGIPCAVMKTSDNSPPSVWIQHDSNFPQAVGVLADHNQRRPLPHWARALEKSLVEKPSVDKAAVTQTDQETQLDLPGIC
jgi:hypothetical protein